MTRAEAIATILTAAAIAAGDDPGGDHENLVDEALQALDVTASEIDAP